MDTNGGRVDVAEEIMQIVAHFPGRTATLVNTKAFSAGAFIATATQEIYMVPESVIGAAAPILVSPTGGVEGLSGTVKAKMNSAMSALVRTVAQKNGHNTEVLEAMIDDDRELKVDGQVLKEKGQILTLTNREAEKRYGNPPKPLFSNGTVADMDALLQQLGFANARRLELKPTGAETLATWLTVISPILLIIGVAGIYLEMKTPGFGLPGIVAICAFALYFLGSYVAGLAGLEWAVLFVLGLALVLAEVFFFTGTLALGLSGAVLMLVALTMALVDRYPGMPVVPTLPMLELPMRQFAIAGLGSMALLWLLSRVLPQTAFYNRMVSTGMSGVGSVVAVEESQQTWLGQTGVALSALRPGGKARFGDEILDVMTQGEMIEKGRSVRVLRFSGMQAVVEAV
jgi:membrane-bound serine protease (ClpP class)